ncbi:MAG: glycosyltransferase family 2 protein [Pirellula sp.]
MACNGRDDVHMPPEAIRPDAAGLAIVATSPLAWVEAHRELDESPVWHQVETTLESTERQLQWAIHAYSNEFDSNQAPSIELSVVMPCLNEADTVARCVQQAVMTLNGMGIASEVIVADNGSTDGSQALAVAAGARVVNVSSQGYGAALMGGIREARGRFVVMGDADASYDFAAIPLFYEKLTAGIELVQGCRLPRGGGKVLKGAMPFLHRWIGNPLLSGLMRTMYGTPVHDVYCGMRGFQREWQASLDQRCTGMEFATEMIIKSTLFEGAIDQVPITLHPDGRIHQRSHLRTFRDGWRTLRFFMLLSPRWTFLIPGTLLAVVGLVLSALAMPQSTILGVTLDLHTLLIGTLAILVASQLVWCAILARTFAITEGLMPPNARLETFFKAMSLERLLVVSGGLGLAGFAIILGLTCQWAATGFGPLHYATSMRWVIPAVGMIALAVQCAAQSFLLSVLRMARL